MNTARAAARIAAIPQVRSAQVTRSWPNRLVIVVRERTPELALPAYGGGGYDLADADGVVLQRVTRRPADLPLYPTVAPEGALRGDPDLAAAAAVLGELPAQVRHSVISVTAPQPGSGDPAAGGRRSPCCGATPAGPGSRRGNWPSSCGRTCATTT